MSPDGPSSTISNDALDRLKAAVGPKGYIDDANDAEPYLTDWRGQYRGTCALVLRPETTEQVAEIVRICAEHRIIIVPQGGNTGMNGAATPSVDGNSILLCLGRMNRVRDLDPLNYTATVEAGCVLQTIQETAADAGRLFPLSLGAEGSCQIGGNLATNAGGVSVLRYGNMRDLVLGLEVVLPSGEIWDGLKALRKDNTGYDLKHLFVGSEGTLGIITAATLKLFPKPENYQTCFASITGLDAVIELLASARRISGDRVSSFELITRPPLDLTFKHGPDLTDPLSDVSDIYALIEFTSSDGDEDDALERFLEKGFEDGFISDAVIAQSEGQRQSLWKLREYLPEAEKAEGASVKHDISVPVSSIPDFVREAVPAVQNYMAEIRPIYFGHVGDGNLHFNFAKPDDMADDDFFPHKDAINQIVLDIVTAYGGSISAEHGIGQLKRDSFLHYTPDLDLQLMRQLKATIDPLGIMNPGKLF
ncbi:MAG TPA: hydroxyacid dehydrogenase [Rhodospirillaceae bacterium]|nr:hydroxyacid dehydrogenase [Rhodospirillaceae bacterium]